MLTPFQYLNDGLHSIEESFVCPQNDDRVYLQHDHASSIKVFTGEGKTGTDLTGNITVANDEVRPYSSYIKLDLTTRNAYGNQTLWLSYTSTGDQMDDSLVQVLRNEIIRLSDIIDGTSSTVPLSIQSTIPADGATNGSSTAKFTANKWLKKSQTNKIKGFPSLTDRVNGTNEISATVTMDGDDSYLWSATSSLSPSSTYYFKVLSGLQGIDGTLLENDYLFSFQTASNQAPSLSVSTTGSTTLGSLLTASTTIGSDPEGDTVQSTTWRWLRSGVAIIGATSTTYTLVEADLGRIITAEATVTMNTGASPAPTQSNAISIPIPNPPSILVSASSGQNTISFTQNSTLSTETYDLYFSTTQTTASGIKSSGTKISNVTSPYVHSPLTNGTQYNYVLTMVVNGVESSPSGVASGTPATNAAPTVSVSVSGTTTIGSILTATATIGSDPEGDTVSSTTWAWLRNDVVISGATASTYTIVEADIGTTLKARATVDMATGSDPAPATSSGTLIPVPTPPSISVSAGNAQNTISFTQNSTLATETYNLYWSTTTGVTKSTGTKITGVTSPHAHSSLINGTTYYYVLTMVINGFESTESAQVSGVPSNVIFRDDFNDNALDTIKFGTSINGSATIVEANGLLTGTVGTNVADAAIIYLKENVIKNQAKIFRHKIRVVQAQDATVLNPFCIQQSTGVPAVNVDNTAINAMQRFYINFRGTPTGYFVRIMAYTTSGQRYYSKNTGWTATMSGEVDAITCNLNTFYIPELVLSETGIIGRVKDESGTVLFASTEMPWVDILNDADKPLWLYMGEPYAAHYANWKWESDFFEII